MGLGYQLAAFVCPPMLANYSRGGFLGKNSCALACHVLGVHFDIVSVQVLDAILLPHEFPCYEWLSMSKELFPFKRDERGKP